VPHAHHCGFDLSSTALTIILLCMAVVSAWGVHRLRADSGRVPAWGAASSLAGLLLIWIAVRSPIASLDHDLLTVHMIQHLLLMTIAPPLLWLGAPVSRPSLGRFDAFVRSALRARFLSAGRQMARLLARPAVCWLAATATLLGWHVPTAFTLGMRSETWHLVEQMSFLGAGLLFWRPVVRAWQGVPTEAGWSIVLYLFFATLPCDLLSGLLVFSERIAYPAYLSVPRRFGLSVLEDQQCAGALMWTVVTIVYFVVGAILSTRLLSPHRSADGVLMDSQLPGAAGLRSHPQGAEAV
jgi:putative membrane protein